MKNILSRIAIALLITSLASVTVFPKTKKATVTFPTSIKVNGTVLSKGVYELKYDYKTGEFVVVKDTKVVARAMASVEKRDRKAPDFMLRFVGSGADLELTGVTFSGADHNVILNSAQASR
jgi:hypothetical protein